MFKVEKSCHQVTVTQKGGKKEKARVNFLISKSLDVNG